MYAANFEHKSGALGILQTELEVIMKDTYGRFKMSEAYKLALHKMSVQVK